jgi:hypothetical protein
MPNLADFFSELKRRRVFRVLVVYAAVAFVIIQVADITFPALNLPDWTLTLVIVLVGIGFPIVIALAWAFDITEKGIVRTGEKAEVAETPRRPIFGNLTLAIVAALAVVHYPETKIPLRNIAVRSLLPSSRSCLR